jgi:hypothetical protein
MQFSGVRRLGPLGCCTHRREDLNGQPPGIAGFGGRASVRVGAVLTLESDEQEHLRGLTPRPLHCSQQAVVSPFSAGALVRRPEQ